MTIIDYTLTYDSNRQETGFIRCFLDNGQIIEFECTSFFDFVFDYDSELRGYADQFPDYTSQVRDLEEIGYDLIPELNRFMNELPQELVKESLLFFNI